MRVGRIAAGLGLLLTVAGAADAALPPQYQRAKELAAVIDAVAATAPDPVAAVEYVDDDLYRVRTGACSIDAHVRTVPLPEGAEPVDGPRRFEVVLDAPKC